MKHSPASLIAAAVIAAAVVAPSALQAYGRVPTTPPTTVARSNPPATAGLDAVKTRAHQAISERLDAIQRVESRVRAIPNLTPDQVSAVTGPLDSTTSGLQALGTQIDAATTVQSATQLARRIVTNYRVYLVALPRARLLAGYDVEAFAAVKLTQAAGNLAGTVPPGSPAAQQVAAARRHLSAAATAVADQDGKVAGLDATGWPGNAATRNAAAAVLRNASQELRAAATALRSAAGK